MEPDNNIEHGSFKRSALSTCSHAMGCCRCETKRQDIFSADAADHVHAISGRRKIDNMVERVKRWDIVLARDLKDYRNCFVPIILLMSYSFAQLRFSPDKGENKGIKHRKSRALEALELFEIFMRRHDESGAACARDAVQRLPEESTRHGIETHTWFVEDCAKLAPRQLAVITITSFRFLCRCRCLRPPARQHAHRNARFPSITTAQAPRLLVQHFWRGEVHHAARGIGIHSRSLLLLMLLVQQLLSSLVITVMATPRRETTSPPPP